MKKHGVSDAPVFSILSSVFNESAHLTSMIDSIRAQELEEWELLLVDDLSTDGTLDIIQNASRQDSRIKLVSTGVKLGKVAAFNMTFQQSRGDLIVLMGGDDIMPSDSLYNRAAALPPPLRTKRVAGYFKLLTMSEDRKFDGMLLPRGKAGSRSGPSITMTRSLADVCFPIPPSLPSEDTWLGELSTHLAEEIVHSSNVSVCYRIHSGNSNPRHKDFATMNESIHSRAQAVNLIITEDRFQLPLHVRDQLRMQQKFENLRYSGKTLSVLMTFGMPLVDRAAIASMSSPALFRIRTIFYRHFTGWRGR